MKTALLATFAAAALAFDGSGSVSSDADLDAYLQGLTGAGVDTGAGQPGNKWPGGHLCARTQALEPVNLHRRTRLKLCRPSVIRPL